MEQINKPNKEINIGISLLRIWMCFEVVLEHFKTWDWDSLNQTSKLHQHICSFLNFNMFMAVPCFMILAFMFTDIVQITKEEEQLKRRLIRLIIPVIFWAILYLIVYLILDYVYGTKLLQFKTDLLWQIAFGHAYNRTLWFQFDLIVITLLYVCIFKYLAKKNAFTVIVFLTLFALMAQYSNMNAIIMQKINLGGYPKTYVLEPLGRLCEMIPYATIGVLIKEFNIFDGDDSIFRILFKIISSIIIIIFLKNVSVFYTPSGFVYQGLLKIVIAFFYVFIFYRIHRLLISSKLNICVVRGGVNFIAKYTMGIYFTQRLIASILYTTGLYSFFRMVKGSFYDCIIIWILSFIICYLLSLIPVKFIKQCVC